MGRGHLVLIAPTLTAGCSTAAGDPAIPDKGHVTTQQDRADQALDSREEAGTFREMATLREVEAELEGRTGS